MMDSSDFSKNWEEDMCPLIACFSLDTHDRYDIIKIVEPLTQDEQEEIVSFHKNGIKLLTDPCPTAIKLHTVLWTL